MYREGRSSAACLERGKEARHAGKGGHDGCSGSVRSEDDSGPVGSTGTASATASSGYALLATGVESQKDGLYFFGANGHQANPWGNTTRFQCVVPPVARAGLLPGSGTNSACDGSFARDLNALWCPSCRKPQKNPGAGALAQAQLWYRDPLSPVFVTTALSDAVALVVGPRATPGLPGDPREGGSGIPWPDCVPGRSRAS